MAKVNSEPNWHNNPWKGTMKEKYYLFFHQLWGPGDVDRLHGQLPNIAHPMMWKGLGTTRKLLDSPVFFKLIGTSADEKYNLCAILETGMISTSPNFHKIFKNGQTKYIARAKDGSGGELMLYGNCLPKLLIQYTLFLNDLYLANTHSLLDLDLDLLNYSSNLCKVHQLLHEASALYNYLASRLFQTSSHTAHDKGTNKPQDEHFLGVRGEISSAWFADNNYVSNDPLTLALREQEDRVYYKNLGRMSGGLLYPVAPTGQPSLSNLITVGREKVQRQEAKAMALLTKSNGTKKS